MNLATLILALVEQAITDFPQLEQSLRNIFAKSQPTAADWQAEREAIAANKYKDLVPHTKLP